MYLLLFSIIRSHLINMYVYICSLKIERPFAMYQCFFLLPLCSFLPIATIYYFQSRPNIPSWRSFFFYKLNNTNFYILCIVLLISFLLGGIIRGEITLIFIIKDPLLEGNVTISHDIDSIKSICQKKFLSRNLSVFFFFLKAGIKLNVR
jgi:hypothetical protein